MLREEKVWMMKMNVRKKCFDWSLTSQIISDGNLVFVFIASLIDDVLVSLCETSLGFFFFSFFFFLTYMHIWIYSRYDC